MTELLTIFREVFERPDMEISDEMTTDNVEGWDSIRHIHLINTIEEKLSIRFKNSELARLRCVGDLRRLIESRQEQKND